MKKYLYVIVGTLILTSCTDKLQKLENSCNANNGNDCLELAHIYETGKEVKQDNLKAMEFYKKTCDAGDVNICLLVAKNYFNGENGITKNNSEGIIYSEKACVLGNVESCYNVAKSFEEGVISEKNIKKSLFYHDKACEMGFGLSCATLGVMYFDSKDVKTDYEKSLEYTHKGCELNINIACYGEGLLYYKKGDYKTALSILAKACDLKEANSCYFLGDLYNNIAKDEKAAKILYERACDLGNQDGCIATNKTGNWKEAIDKDKFTGNIISVYANVSTDSFYNDLGQEKKPMILASCQDNTITLGISFDTVVSCSDMKIGLKFDDQQPYYEYWTVNTACNGAISAQPIKLLLEMMGKKQLMVRFIPHGSGHKDVTFDIRGIEKVVENLAYACHLKK